MRTETDLRPLTARSVVLSLLLGADPPELPGRDLVRLAGLLGVGESALRVALTRMVGAGDLVRADGVHRLSDRLVERQRRQNTALNPETTDWDGDWNCVVVTATGRSPADRAALRTALTDRRLAELREGVWLRPANLPLDAPALPTGLVQAFRARPEADPAMLASTLWDLAAWSTTANTLHDLHRRAATPAERFTAAAAIVRHLAADPVLPLPLLPEPWPAADLRAAYSDYRAELTALRSAL
ncbi:PaaX domain-containing protein, C- domain protein [Actinokineospora sp. PR83]|uniref:PaaX family transcriptional regulator C-terminal domain-containing protein n=1 Tax=Actinokineospora sp. PR83 TaxID=2884908 RepID=UPI001F2F50D7|nr:PaaX family transcriptional regulator C-terminal domain-containing protein [Actinokineospora sp. PR83]MCG8914551.1 PaaX domain-containing protein, C- domain protein [Actinokineospora sp. PR83]